MVFRAPFAIASTISVVWLGAVSAGTPDKRPVLRTSDSCIACHNGLVTPSGQDVSIGLDWRASIMANSARDPYWQASVRRETIDHPLAAASIEDTCATCHMPLSRADAAAHGQRGDVFQHLPPASRHAQRDALAQDGVSCAICHQIAGDKLGTPDSFSGGFVLAPGRAAQTAASHGPFPVDAGRAAVMQSASSSEPVEAAHIRGSEMCGTCHTLYTRAVGPDGKRTGQQLPEQMSFLEWRHSGFRDEKSCQSCHMPPVREPAPIASVLGIPREGVVRHVFRGGNFFMLRILNRYGRALGVTALPEELEASVRWTTEQLQSETAEVAIDRAERAGSQVSVDVTVRNLTGHKLPTGFPSRRAWLHVVIHDRGGRIVFESGALTADGRIEHNDNDADAARYEAHFPEIRRVEDVQIYESIVGDAAGNVTTGILSGTHYLKDNRLLPRGFDKQTAESDIAVVGAAGADADFAGGSDRVRYIVDASSADGPLQVDVELRYQPIGFRWAKNLEGYSAMETRRFVDYFRTMGADSAITLARASATVR
jgi:cytochrome c551/c552